MKGDKVSKVVKWVGYLTAILSLIAGLGGLGKVIWDRVQSHRKIDSLLASEKIQSEGRDYRSAWQFLEQASHINPDSRKVRAAQQDLAMAWLENVEVSGDEKFSDVMDKLEPVLTGGAASTKEEPRHADLLAHIGWTYFLRSREARFDLDPAVFYAQAVKTDENNPYAQAMWGHWILWNHGSISDAEQHFASALASNRQRDYVRMLQLSALLNCGDDCDEEIIRVANAMRKEQRLVPPDTRNHIYFLYYVHLSGDMKNPASARFVNAVPPVEHVETFRWLFEKADFDESKSIQRTYFLAVLQEAAGQRENALANYTMVRGKISHDSWSSLKDGTDMGIKRLSRPKE